ncbi:MAG: hypothetical protein AAGF73_18800 [Actinomycetota bacterium]
MVELLDDPELWNSVQNAAAESRSVAFWDASQRAGNALDELYDSAAALPQAKAVQEVWVLCMGGDWSDPTELNAALASGLDGESLSSGQSASSIQDQADECEAAMVDDFNALLLDLAPEWAERNQPIFTDYLVQVRSTYESSVL